MYGFRRLIFVSSAKPEKNCGYDWKQIKHYILSKKGNQIKLMYSSAELLYYAPQSCDNLDFYTYN